MAKNYKTPIKAMRAKCLDCSNGSTKELQLCSVLDCPLYPYCFGKKPTKAIVDTINEFHNKKHGSS